ncbi:MAG TPA: hypothetical protein VGI85_02865 [Chthoniobacterales bacterium]
MKRFELDLNGSYSSLDAEEIAALIRAGAVRQGDPCRALGEERWQTVRDLFPLLNFGSAPNLQER